MPMRADHRQPNEPRPIEIRRQFTQSAAGSVLVSAGRTTILCTASVEDQVPDWMAGRGRGWITAEYSMLPGSTAPRKRRERGGKVDSRGVEIQRLIGRSLRAVADLDALGERTVALDCDVLEADGGTRTLSITGATLALVDALATVRDALPDPTRYPLSDSLAAVSVGLVPEPSGGSLRAMLDLCHAEDSAAAVDMNVVMTGGGRFVEVQGTGEEATFTRAELDELLDLAQTGIARLTAIQQDALGDDWPF
jgi:ribonuclease PH